MGVPGLWSLLEPTGQPITLESLEGKRLAIDVSLWLHQAAEGYLRHEVSSGARSPHLALLIHRISKLLYYKVRPVFVFDGDRVPVFKQQLLRERRLKQHVEELTVSREQRRMLSNIAHCQQDSSLKKFSRKRTTEKEELFVLPSTSTADLEVTVVENDPSDLGTFAESLSADDRIRLLLDARECARNERLTPAQIPDDSHDFSRFQIQRLLQRNKITSQLDMLCKEKERQYAMPFSNSAANRVMFDGGNRSHILARHNDVEIIDPEKEERDRVLKESLSWPAMLQQMREEYEGTKSSVNHGPCTSSSFSSMKVERMEVDEDNDSEEEDDAFQEAILLSLREESRAKRHGNTPFVFSKSTVVENTTKRIAATRAQIEAMQQDSWSSSSESDDFVDVPIVPSSGIVFSLPSFSDPGASTSQPSQRRDEEGVYVDCQKLLELCGIPYVLAPGEAEAQCAALEKLGLVDGVVTDDSDIWLFGGKTVYRNMFHRKKRVQKYCSSVVKDTFGLTRDEFIYLAMLSGGDYSRGFDGVGVVTALELISEFTGNDCHVAGVELLKKIREWLDAKKKSKEENFIESKARIKLRRYLETNNNHEVIEKFPNPSVFEAYADPLVDQSKERFHWGVVSFDPMYNFLWEKLGWNEAKVLSASNRAFERWSEFLKGDVRRYQTRITAFLEQPLEKLAAEQRLTPSSRAQIALRKLVEKKGMKPSEILLASSQTKRKAEDTEEANDSFNESEDDWMLVPSSTSKPSGDIAPPIMSTSETPKKEAVLIGNKEFDVSTVRKLRDAVKNLNHASTVEIPADVQPMMFRSKKKKRNRVPPQKKKRLENEEELKLSESDSDD
ncbi:hypothetical protein QR680_019263 [Steinernema hermaphroditum]|uniref:XPG-I domain-containing protein n=1 Tax=Steinernema hermaphroditum TaxID=289476 RepID=A0AA39HKH7_9BILA|nr:hypothetical protein QR680_019263 [Steinernema hermaphroditum]